MIMYGQRRCEDLKRENQYLQDELDTERERRRQQQEDEYREQQERRRNREREYRESLCYASDWPEAFSKGLIRIGEEARAEASDNVKYKDDPEWATYSWFQDWHKEVRRAQEIYDEVMREAEEEIKKIRLAALGKVADRLQAEVGETETVQAIRDNNPEYLVAW